MSGLTLDAGALIAAERGDRRVIALLARAARRRLDVAIPSGALAAVWRADPRQHRLHLLLSDDCVEVPPLDREEALAVGAICARTRTNDVIDASVASCARRRHHTVDTSDPDDIHRVDPTLSLIPV